LGYQSRLAGAFRSSGRSSEASEPLDRDADVAGQGVVDREPIPADRAETRRQIRGSALLLAGRVGALGANLVTQVLIARYLAKSDFGAFAYALSLVNLVETVITLGLDRAIPRFLPLYQERREYDKFAGTLVLVIGTIVALSLAAFLFVFGLQGWLGSTVIDDAQAASLLLILILLAPLNALDALFTDVYAVFASARSIFIRKYVLAPGFRFVVVVLLVLGQFDVPFLAAGYVAAGLAGVFLYAAMLPRMFARAGLTEHLDLRRMRVALPEVLAYTVPLLSTDLVQVFMTGFDALLLGRIHGTQAVGALSVVDPAARTNTLVIVSFSLLFVPVATRFFARGEHEAMNDLYWRSAAWMAVLSFPIFAVTFALAEQLTVTLYEQRYASSALFLSLIALGRYVDAAFGPNGFALRVYGRMKPLVLVNIFAAGFHLAVSVLLIPPFGPLGAAVAVCATFIAYNIAKQLALQWFTGVRMFDARYARVYLSVVIAAVGLVLANLIVRPSLPVGVAGVAIVSAVLLMGNRDHLRIGETFPELLRLPGARRLLGG
jgi:O-antigen/teichoic acid export membrane protein